MSQGYRIIHLYDRIDNRFCITDKDVGLGVRSILYSINYKIVIVRLYLYLRGRFCTLLEQKGGSVVDGPGAILMNQSLNEHCNQSLGK